MADGKLIIGTRSSKLAIWQADTVEKLLRKNLPELTIEQKLIKTTGDKILDVSLSKIDDKGLFTKQIEDALISGEIDIAVHSLKDLQTVQPDELTIGAVLEREKANDVLISTKYRSINDLPNGATVATGSLRRTSLLLSLRPDLKIVDIRGNIPTRFTRFQENNYDAMILAYAGVHRLGLDEHIAEIIPADVMIPAVGQGAVAVEIRKNDSSVAEMIGALDHAETRICISAERAFLQTLEGGCRVPIGAYAVLENGVLKLNGFAGSTDGTKNIFDSISGEPHKAEQLGRELAGILITKGAAELLADERENSAI